MSDIRKTTLTQVKKDLRTVRQPKGKAFETAKVIVYAGAVGKDAPAACNQFNEDVRLYGLWEALLYVEGYEEQGHYAEGTAEKAIAALVANP